MAGFEGFEWIVFNHFNTKILPVCSRKIRFPRLYFSIKFLDKTVPFEGKMIFQDKNHGIVKY